MSPQRLVNSIEKGIVIDHISAGTGVRLFHILKLDEVNYPVVMITNAASKRMGSKDLIKIENIIDLDYAVIGLIDHNATISIIDGGKVIEKKLLKLPKTVTNVIRCKNPRCITSVEGQAPHIFHLHNPDKCIYRCAYCEDHVRGFEI